MVEILRKLLSSSPLLPSPSLRDFWARHRAETAGLSTMDRALVGGFSADRVGYAFAAGYQAALRALVPSLPDAPLASFCVTEEGGGHPRAIQAELRPLAEGGYRLDGRKTFATLALPEAVLLVVARTGVDAAGRNRLAVAQVSAQAPGVARTPLPETPFVPEVPHAVVALADVRVAAQDVLEGDGYARYVKPFRTVEDLHVHAAVLAHILGGATRSGWPQPFRERLAFLLVGLRALGEAPPSAPEVHVALGGAIAQARALLEEARGLWEDVAPELRERWTRDAPLLWVAEKARGQRLAKAWERLTGGDAQDD